MRLLDPGFKWVPAVATDVRETWRRFGYKPITQEEREARQHAPGVYFPKTIDTPAPRAGRDSLHAPHR